MNALEHGLATPDHILLAGEDEAAFEMVHANLIAEFEPEDATAWQLVHRLAVTFWKQRRADRLERKLFASTASEVADMRHDRPARRPPPHQS
jgi:hypothetical protein